jgi:hypothetical protein
MTSMTADRAARLTALGFTWDAAAAGAALPNEAAWEAQLVRMTTYRAAHGDCDVPNLHADDLPLGRWVDKQRTLKRKLDRGEPCEGMTAERAARLTALGFTWDAAAAAWEAQFVRLTTYRAAHGDCDVPKRYAKDKPPLGRWVGNQRTLKRKLDHGEPSGMMTAKRAAQLTVLGFAWGCAPKAAGAALPNEAAWEAQLVRLATYRAAHGDCDVPYLHADDLQLSRWVDKQRTLKRKLDRGEPCDGMTAERAARLTALGFAWELR